MIKELRRNKYEWNWLYPQKGSWSQRLGCVLAQIVKKESCVSQHSEPWSEPCRRCLLHQALWPCGLEQGPLLEHAVALLWPHPSAFSQSMESEYPWSLGFSLSKSQAPALGRCKGAEAGLGTHVSPKAASFAITVFPLGAYNGQS